MDSDFMSATRGSVIAYLSCDSRLLLDHNETVAQAQVNTFVAAHKTCPNFQITMTLNLTDQG